MQSNIKRFFLFGTMDLYPKLKTAFYKLFTT